MSKLVIVLALVALFTISAAKPQGVQVVDGAQVVDGVQVADGQPDSVQLVDGVNVVHHSHDAASPRGGPKQ